MWSKVSTWGFETPPTKGDSAFVANGDTLCIDEDVIDPIFLL